MTTVFESSPLVSVVIPVYNSVNTIEQTIQSVFNQTYSNLEIIIVNDGSTDNSLAVIKKIILQVTKQPVQIIDKENGGVSTARNAGMLKANGEYIALLDSDDVWLPEKIANQIQVFNSHPGIDLLGCNRNGEIITKFLFKKFERLTLISSKWLLYKNFFSTPTVIFKKDILETLGFFDESQRFAEEGNYWIRICNKKKCMLLNESYVITGGGKPNFGHSGLSGNLLEMEKGELKNIKDAYKLKVINNIEFIMLNIYSIAKYLRRILIVKLR